MAQSAVDRFVHNAYDPVVEGESYRRRLKPHLRSDDPPPNTPTVRLRLYIEPADQASSKPVVTTLGPMM